MTINEANKNRIEFYEIKNPTEDDIFDTKAILIKNINNKKLGYIPEKDNVIFSRLMDAGKLLKARVKNIENLKGFTKIQISIFLFDF